MIFGFGLFEIFGLFIGDDFDFDVNFGEIGLYEFGCMLCV